MLTFETRDSNHEIRTNPIERGETTKKNSKQKNMPRY
jgi:hypothetical protein